MKYKVLDILVYLFDYLVYEKKTRPSIEEMQEELNEAGFAEKDIDRALVWLIDLNDLQADVMIKAPSSKAIRVFTEKEKEKLPTATRGFIYQLTKMGVIDTRLREIIIQKLLALDEDIISVNEVKWVTLMAVYNRPGQEANAVWLERSLVGGSGFAADH
ncbi:MAG: hypothetical protein CSA45_04750 [Gammaproteobacteria bacterium]|nr:MAG: hypothetical protein CSA45_04750 [Gammaproteobacteria bacterium]